VTLVASDCGPAFRDLNSALRDGYDDSGPIDPIHMLRRNGIGGGLGAIVRFTHSFSVETTANGKQIRVARYLQPAATSRR
jgi:hypothetical protein